MGKTGQDPKEGPGPAPGEGPGGDPGRAPEAGLGKDPGAALGQAPQRDPEKDPGKDPEKDPEKGPGTKRPETLGSLKDDDFDKIQESQRNFIRQLALYARRMRMIFRTLALILVVALFVAKGAGFGLGALMGAIIVEINLSVFVYVVKRTDPTKRGGPILVTILKFYALFAGTILYVFLCIYLGVGKPMGFLFGILSFLPALLLTLLWALGSHLGKVSRKRGGGEA
jgi:hypothetical protein